MKLDPIVDKLESEYHKRVAEIKFTLNLGDVGYISADPNELQEAFTNIISNALEAMPVGGEIIITTIARQC